MHRDEERHSRSRNQSHALVLGVIAATSAALFALLTTAVMRRQTAQLDQDLLETVAADDDEVRDAAESLHPFGKWWSYVPAAVVTGGIVIAAGSSPMQRRVAGAASMLAATLTSAVINPAFDQWLPQPPAPPGRREKPKPSFPSGHTFGVGSLTFTTGYVLVREELLHPLIVVPVALMLPLVSGGARMTEEKHWPTDVAGGALVGIFISAMCLAVFEAAVPDGDE